MENINGLFGEVVVEPFFYLWAVPAMIIFGISKGGFAGNMGIVSLPMIAMAVPVDQAAAIMLPVLCCMDLFGLLIYKKEYDRTNVRMLLPFAVLGILGGWLLFNALDKQTLTFLIGLMAFAYILHQGWRKLPRKRLEKPFRHSWWKASLSGSLLGMTSTIAHAGGVPTQMYLLPQKMDKAIFVGTTVILFTWVNYLKLIPYYFLGQLHTGNLGTSMMLLPLAPVGMYLGKYLQGKIKQEGFYRLCYAMLFFTGLKLMYDGFPL